jgi:AcrR family transcriptional regulator
MTRRNAMVASPARERVVAAALDLFAEYGVSGTSLQMIADRMGVTKAAVYHQFQTKDDIVLAVIGPVLDRLTAIADAAEREKSRSRRLDVALRGVVDLVVEHRRVAAVMQFDPIVGRLVQANPGHPAFDRIRAIFTGDDPDSEAHVRAAMVSGGLMIAGVDPALSTLSDDDLRSHLLSAARRILGRPAGRG